MVKIDKYNNIWSGGYFTSLTKFDGQVWRNINASNSCLTSDHIFCLAFDDSENIWIGAYTPYDSLYGGLAVYNENGINDLRFNNEALPEGFVLVQNYPNPFNSSTRIRYIVDKTSQIQIKIFDILGYEIGTLVNEEKYPGEYEEIWNPQSSPSGVYILQLKSESYIQSKKMVYLK
ncbi:MAG: T9SS type A sorting domain-containing protein [Ignavibacterium album]|uniref:T9SS type A sorting domain-containing protein n=1 Tax=Ignavibacterium album TaxID=591197 RepID=UPI0026EB62D2|nr:T9SS type A sorting domain-containing protein [Ignavibacterium album]MCX8106736.1 T9SS type A sorting domain-containing protein [Ignavibacterium album]